MCHDIKECSTVLLPYHHDRLYFDSCYLILVWRAVLPCNASSKLWMTMLEPKETRPLWMIQPTESTSYYTRFRSFDDEISSFVMVDKWRSFGTKNSDENGNNVIDHHN